MKNIVILLLAITPLFVFSQGSVKNEIAWTSLDKAKVLAKKHNKKTLVFFYKKDCSYCEKMKKETPYLFFSGSMDPVGNYGKGVNEVVDKCKRLNFSNVTCKIFEEGRHEMLNETNKEEVYEYVYSWINKNTSK